MTATGRLCNGHSSRIANLPMKVLVTGSSGFIGQALVRRLRLAGHEVTGLDRAPGATTEHVCDIIDAERLNAIIAGSAPDTVVHLAARIDIDESDTLAGYASNIQGVENVIAAVRNAPSVKRAIWT